jgi:L-aminopeptidase/D-esterase-like protein
LGATTVNFKGGIGSASAVMDAGFAVGALAAVNAAGSVVIDDGPWFWAAPYEQNGEFGGHGFPPTMPAKALAGRTKGAPGQSTTLVVVATDANLSKAQAKHMAVMAQDGLARSIHPVHTPLDGDIVFAAATGRRPLHNAHFDLTAIGAAAAQVVARAIARGVFEADSLNFPQSSPGYKQKF